MPSVFQVKVRVELVPTAREATLFDSKEVNAMLEEV